MILSVNRYKIFLNIIGNILAIYICHEFKCSTTLLINMHESILLLRHIVLKNNVNKYVISFLHLFACSILKYNLDETIFYIIIKAHIEDHIN